MTTEQAKINRELTRLYADVTDPKTRWILIEMQKLFMIVFN